MVAYRDFSHQRKRVGFVSRRFCLEQVVLWAKPISVRKKRWFLRKTLTALADFNRDENFRKNLSGWVPPLLITRAKFSFSFFLSMRSVIKCYIYICCGPFQPVTVT